MLNRRRFVLSLSLLPMLSAGGAGSTLAAQSVLDRLGRSVMGSRKGADEEEIGEADVADGLREALRVGTERVVLRLGREDGFNLDEVAHIPLPRGYRKARKMLKRVGMGRLADDLELRLNRAAEVATPRAKAIFWQSIKDMTLRDVMDIYRGPDDAATQYFRRTMTPQLVLEMKPIIDTALAEVGAIAAYDAFMARYREIPLVPDVKGDLSDHVMEKALDGIFHYMAVEEAAIRRDPVKRTTDILKRVFGAL